MSPNRIAAADLLLFNRQLVSLIKTNLPLSRSLAMLSKEAGKPRLRNAIRGLQEAVEAGRPLSKAVAARPDLFPKLYAKIIEAGERSDNLVGVLAQFVKYSETATEMRERVRDALMYPAFVLVSTLLVAVLFVFFVIPTMTRVVVGLWGGLGEPGFIEETLWYQTLMFVAKSLPPVVVVLFSVLILGVIACLILRLSPGGRAVLDRIKLGSPIYGPCYRLALLSRFGETLGLLIRSNVPLGDALYLTGQCSPSPSLRAACERLQRTVEGGRTLSEAISADALLGPMLAYMVSIGERREAPHEELESAAEIFSSTLRMRARRSVLWIDTVVLVCVGLVVVSFAWLIYRPLFMMIRGMGEY
jgi:type II secretory pathway component PulF